MYFAPGSHKQYPMTKRFVRTPEGTAMIPMGATGAPVEGDYVAAPVDSGSLVLIHGMVHHKSGPNKSLKSRWIYTFHMIEGEYGYPADNWYILLTRLQPTQMQFTKIY